ncbi:MAG: dUTP diphosphatase [Sphaerochaeta sp.]
MNFKQIVSNQYSLNDLMSKKTWLNNPNVDMHQAAVDEAITELVPATGWVSWWKKVEPQTDFYNCQLEVIDILHFHIGAAIQELMYETVYQKVAFAETESSTECLDLMKIYPTQESFEKAWDSGQDMVNLTEQEREHVIEELAGLLEPASREAMANENPRRAVQSYVGALLQYGAIDSISNFFDLAATFHLSTEHIMWMYAAKHTLNEFRAHNNYKGDDPSRPPYSKIWDGREDNAHLMDWVRERIASKESLTKTQITEFLQTTYQSFHG